MELSQVDYLAVGSAVTAVWMCGVARIYTLLWMLALQTSFLALITAGHGIEQNSLNYILLAAAVLIIKAIGIPAILAWSVKKLTLTKDKGIFISITTTLLVGCLILIGGYFLAPKVAVMSSQNVLAAGMSISLLGTGMLIMITRRLAISQIIGFLCFENGIFLFGLTQSHEMPVMVEMGIVFEVLVGVMVAGVVISKLNRSFEHIDVTEMRELRQ